MQQLESLVLLQKEKPEVKSLVIGILGREFPLSPVQLFDRVKERDGSSISYQAVHKAIHQLCEQGVVCKCDGGYSLSNDWVNWLKETAKDFSYNYSEKKQLSISDVPVGSKISMSANTLSMLARLVFERNLRLNSDSWFLYDNRVNITPTSAFVEIAYKCRESKLTSLIYSGAKRAGYEWAKHVVQIGKFPPDPTKLTMHAGDMFSFAGWSSLYVSEFDPPAHHISLILENSAEAAEFTRLHGKSKVPVCDVARGLFAGGYSIPLREPSLEFIETKCKAKGDSNCVIVGKPRDEFGLGSKETIRQLGEKSEPTDLSFLGE